MFHRSAPNLAPEGVHGIRPLSSEARSSDWSDQALRRTWRSVGGVCVLIGIINAFIPLMPTTVFLLIGLWAYGKGDPALAARLLQHPCFGRSLRLWVEHRQITRRGKVAAIVGMSVGSMTSFMTLGMRPLTWGMGVVLVVLGLYLATRKEPQAAC